MTDFEYSPHRSAGGTLHLLSPTHGQYGLDSFPSIKQIRRSLSRSPSKPQRFQMHNMKSPGKPISSPLSPSTLSRTPSTHNAPESSFKSRFSMKRSVTTRSAPRKVSPNSPIRRVMAEGQHNNGHNATAANTRRTSADGQENRAIPSAKDMRFELDNEPIKFDALKARADKPTCLTAAMREHMTPVKSSPLKRSDGVMNLDHSNLGSPMAKRRSLHGASFGVNFDVFDQGFDGASNERPDTQRRGSGDSLMGFSPAPPQRSPQRKPIAMGLRRTTLQQRANHGAPRPKSFIDVSEGSSLPTMAASSASPAPTRPASRVRVSFDSALPLRGLEPPVFNTPPPAHRPTQPVPKPHPLSNTLSPSSSASSIVNESPSMMDLTAQATPRPAPPPGFSKSLPIGALRPRLDTSGDADGGFETPGGYQMAKPLPTAFMSTGLISKRNRDIDMAPSASFGSGHMPDTPSKKTSASIMATTPATSSSMKFARPKHEFGSPTTPFSHHTSKGSPESFGKGVSIFGTRMTAGKLIRRSSFLSIDGDDCATSPSGKMDIQLANDDLPPTPTKPASFGPRPQSKGKGNSLRSSLLGRRSSLAPDTFNNPSSTSMTNETAPLHLPAISPVSYHPSNSFDGPLTPSGSYTPPDASRLSISGEHHGSSFPFNASLHSFPPATPTGPRDGSFNFSVSQGAGSSSLLSNDVDTSLTARFGSVHVYGNGEFSIVYRVEKPLDNGVANTRSNAGSHGSVWAVKKSKKAYAGSKDRARKMREVQILKALRGHEHIIDAIDTWEMKNHLYIQTDFCENGNLKDFLLQAGFKARLDDFRIWKILLELAQGVRSIHDASFIHLDLKPANIFIDWEGVLKIGDFGMASAWPAPMHLDGEGDREYIAPEILHGRFDKPADIFSLGMVMLEIAGNIVLPDNGTSWQRLRAGDLSDLASLTFSTDSSLMRDESGEPITSATVDSSPGMTDDLGFRPRPTNPSRPQDLVTPPRFMADPNDPEALDKIVQWAIAPNPDHRPSIDELLACGGVQWVDGRRRAGATVYEGNWGPADEVVASSTDIEMLDM